jgi:hypothetical protein
MTRGGSALLLSGCGIVPFETPTAYDAQRYLCDDPVQLDANAQICDDDPLCNGLFDFQGTIQGVPLVVGSRVERNIVQVSQTASGEQLLSRVRVTGLSPYFRYELDLASLGAEWTEKGAVSEFEVVFGTDTKELDLDDGAGSLEWAFAAGTDSATLEGLEDQGTISVPYVSEARIDLRFAGSIGSHTDEVEGCLVVYPERIEIVPVP